MARDGSGNFSRAVTPPSNGDIADADDYNAEQDDVADALSDSINIAGTKAFAADQSMGGFKLTNLAAPSGNNDAARKKYVDDAIVAAAQPLDATLTALAAGTTGANVLFYWSGTDTLSTTTLTSAARTVLDDTTVAAMVATLGAASLSTDIVYTDSDYRIAAATNDASDTYALSLCGGGTPATSRGGFIQIVGNEHASVGKVSISGGNAGGGAQVEIDPSGSGAGYLNIVNGDIRRPLTGASTSNNSVGYLGLPQVSKTGNYSLALSDIGKRVRFNGTSLVCTVTKEATVAWATGDFNAIVRIMNISASAMTIVQDTGVTLVHRTLGTGTRTLAQYGVATLEHFTTDTWLISGDGIT